MRSLSLRTTCQWLIQLLASGLLITSAIIHWGNPYSFLGSILQYDLVSPRTSIALAAFLPSLTLAVGCFLLISGWSRVSLTLASVLFGCFAFAQWSALISDKMIGCGCFGASGSTVSTVSASAVSALAMVTLACALLFTSPPGAEARRPAAG